MEIIWDCLGKSQMITNKEKQMLRNLEIAFQIVLIEDRKLLEELARK